MDENGTNSWWTNNRNVAFLFYVKDRNICWKKGNNAFVGNDSKRTKWPVTLVVCTLFGKMVEKGTKTLSWDRNDVRRTKRPET